MTKKTGVPTLIDIAHAMCQAIAKFSPLIAALYPENAALQAALAAANAACATLGSELALVREYGD